VVDQGKGRDQADLGESTDQKLFMGNYLCRFALEIMRSEFNTTSTHCAYRLSPLANVPHEKVS
jgi:hypothetical protein